MTNKVKIAATILMLALVALYIVIYVIPGVTGALKRTEIVNYGEVKVSVPMSFYIVRNEQVYLSGQSGDINYYFEEGSHVRRGTKVLDIVRKTIGESDEDYEEMMVTLGEKTLVDGDYVTDLNGIVSYYVDGYEGYFSPENIPELTYEAVSKLEIEPVNLTRKETAKGNPLYKLCDSSSWYLIGWVEKGEISKFNLGGSAQVQIGEEEIAVVTENIMEDGDKWLIVMKTDRYYSDFPRVRTGEALVITANATGIIISNESITTDEEGNIGVFVKKKNGDYVFTPIKVINTDGLISAVEASVFYDAEGKEVYTVEVYDEILKNAGN
jgi:putative membrane fusion protein